MNQHHKIIYFDNNATTPIDKRLLDAMLLYLTTNYANPISTPQFGNLANQAVKKAKIQIADLISADENEVIFTKGSMESINIALKVVAENYPSKGRYIITVSTEHYAVIDTSKHLKSKGYEINYLPVSNDDLMDLNEIKNSFRADTINGIGALYVRQRLNSVKMPTYRYGGGHEQGLRCRTLNVSVIIASSKECEIAQEEMKKDAEGISKLCDKLENELLKIEGTFVNGKTENRILNTTNICFRGNEANVMIGGIKNVAESKGSACTAAVVEASHVLTSMGLSDDDVFASIRFSLGRLKNRGEIKQFLNIYYSQNLKIK